MMKFYSKNKMVFDIFIHMKDLAAIIKHRLVNGESQGGAVQAVFIHSYFDHYTIL